MTDLYAQNQKIISSRDESIKEKEERIKLLEKELTKFYKDEVPFIQISKEAKINHTYLSEISFGKIIKSNFNKIDTLTVFYTVWSDSTQNISKEKSTLRKWLKTRLNNDKIQVN